MQAFFAEREKQAPKGNVSIKREQRMPAFFAEREKQAPNGNVSIKREQKHKLPCKAMP